MTNKERSITMNKNIKIYAFEVREDEKAAFAKYEKQFGVTLAYSDQILTLENIELVRGYDAVSTLGQGTYGKAELDALKEMGISYLSTRTIGYNHIDITYAAQIGIHVCNSAYAPNGVAEYTIMMILLCLRNYKPALWRTQVNDYSLTGLIGRELKDLTVGIIGTGRIGYTVMKALSGFGCRILAYDPYPNESSAALAKYVDLKTLYENSDVISLHMPLTPQTEHMINQNSISQMKDGVVLINCARGPLMDIDALIENIENCKIGALGLDCMEEEDDIVHRDLRTDIITNRRMAYLRQFPNVVHTQHMAFYTDAAVDSMVYYGICGICEMMQGHAYAHELKAKAE
jgi:D-lactate dehydrogenase